jgi:protein ImuB
MWWAAMLITNCAAPPDAAAQAVATWALQISPRVTLVDEAVLVEVQGSERLFGGRIALGERLQAQASELGVSRVAWGPTRLGALAMARAGVPDPGDQPLSAALDALPLRVLSAALEHRDTLTQLGCGSLGDLRRLPRGGIVRRFGSGLLEALDQAYGLRPDACAWVTAPERFVAHQDLAARVELASALLFSARRLVLQLGAWLVIRHAGATAITLSWRHDDMRSRQAGAGGALSVRTAVPTRDVDHLYRLLAENLARTELAAPVGALTLTADEVQPLAPDTESLLPQAVPTGEALRLVLERLAARLGPQRVLRPVLREDHRPEWMQGWQPADVPLPRQVPRRVAHPQPTFMLPKPLPLAVREGRPVYQGPLTWLAGPHRVEGGWWHRVAGADGDAPGQNGLHVQRDYWLAHSQHAGLLWIFQERLSRDAAGTWSLHGNFA